MNFEAQTGFDAARCCGIAVAAFAIGWPMGGRRRHWTGWACLLAPLLMPSLLLSYAAAPLALHLSGGALAAFYCGLLTLKLAAIAALARDLFPPALSDEAAYCASLLPGGAIEKFWFRVRGAGASRWVVLAVMFLLSFTDFELASLLGVKTWAVMLFDAHAGGLALGESLTRVAWPLMIQCAVLAPLPWVIRPTAPGEVTRREEGRGGALARWALVIGICAAPLGRIAWLAASGVASLRAQEIFAVDLLVSVGFAAGASLLAWIATRRLPFWGTLPGLLGPLVLALIILAAIQLPGLRWARETPVPLLIAQAFLLTPLAWLMRRLVEAGTPREALHLARMAGSRRLIWDLALRPRAAMLALLFLLAYFEFTAASILMPLGMTPVFVRLHNLAHYGQTPVLSAMLLGAVAAPFAVLALTLGAAHLYARRRS